MQIPAILYGTHADVLKRCRKALTRFLREHHPLISVLEAAGMVDTTDLPGLLVLDQPDSYFKKEVHFHCYVPLALLTPWGSRSLGPIGDVREQEVLAALLDRPWGLLCLFDANIMNHWFTRDEPLFYARYVRAMLRSWNVLDHEGWRYSTNGERLWDAAVTIVQALARLGVPKQAMGWQQPLPTGGLAALAVQADPTLAGDLIAFAASILATQTDSNRSAAGEASLYRHVFPSSAPPVVASDELVAAIRANDVDLVRRLIEAGEQADVLDDEMYVTPISWAAAQGYSDLVGLLLDHGAPIEDRADEGESPLMLAAQGGHHATVQLLLDRGADVHYVTEKGWGAVGFAEMGHHEELATLLRQARVRSDQAVPMGAAMGAAMRMNDPATVIRLLEAGESVKALNLESLQRPLEWAAVQGHAALVLFLLNGGAAVDERSGAGETPLMHAAWMGHTDIVRLLLTKGADPHAACDRGLEAIDYAKMRNHAEVAALIEAALSTLD